MACTTTASGQSVSIAYIEEQNCGETPNILTNAVGEAAITKTGAAVGETKMTAPGGTDWITDANVLPGHYLITTAYSSSVNNGTWRVLSVTSTDLILADPDNVTVDEAPAGPGPLVQATMAFARLTERNINLEKDLLTSEEVRPSRQVADVRHGFNQVTGSLGFELSLLSYDDFIRAALYGSWVQPDTSTAGNITVDADSPVVGQTKFTRAVGTWDSDGIRPGDILVGASFPNALNNVQWRVLSVSGAELVAQGTGFDEGPVAGTLSYVGYRVDLGPSPLRTFTMERRFEDVQQYQVYRGVSLDTWSVSVDPENIVSGSHDVLGMKSTALSPANLVPLANIVAAPTTGPFASFDAVLIEGGLVNGFVTSFDYELANNGSLEGVIGSKFSPGVFRGTAMVEGNLTFFLADEVTYNKFYDETDSSIFLRLQDPADPLGFMSIVLPRVKLNTGDMDPPQEGAVELSMDYQSLAVATFDENGAATETSLTVQVSSLR